MNVVPAEKVPEEIVSNEAYILFYQRRKVDSAECSGSNSSSSEHWLSKMAIPPNPSASSTTISSDAKKEEVDKLPEGSEKRETSVAHNDIQTDKSVEQKIEGIIETTTVEECATESKDGATTVESSDVPIKVEPTNEDEIVDVEGLDTDKPIDTEPLMQSPSKSDIEVMHEEEEVNRNEVAAAKPIEIDDKERKPSVMNSVENDIDIEVELRNLTVKKSEGALSMSFPTQRSLWPFENHHNTIHTYTPILSRGSLNFNELLANERSAHLRHSLSTSLGPQRSSASSDKVKFVTANDTLAMVRGVSSCSKDTLIYIDQQTHHRSIMDEEANFIANQPLWVNFVELNCKLRMKFYTFLNPIICFSRFLQLHHIN